MFVGRMVLATGRLRYHVRCLGASLATRLLFWGGGIFERICAIFHMQLLYTYLQLALLYFHHVACATEKCSFHMEVSLAMTLSGRGELKFSVKLRETDSSRGSLDHVDIRCSTCSPGHLDTLCQVKTHNSVGIEVIRPYILNV